MTFHSKTCFSQVSLSLSDRTTHRARDGFAIPRRMDCRSKKSRAMKLSLSLSPMTRERIAPLRAPFSKETERETERGKDWKKNERDLAFAIYKNIVIKGAPETRFSRLSSTNPRWRECRRTNRTAT